MKEGVSFLQMRVKIIDGKNIYRPALPPLELLPDFFNFARRGRLPSAELFRPLMMNDIVLRRVNAKIGCTCCHLPSERAVSFHKPHGKITFVCADQDTGHSLLGG